VSLCLRYDFLKTLNLPKLTQVLEWEKTGTAEKDSYMDMLITAAKTSPKHYFISVLIGYLVAIVSTVVIMIIFNTG